MFHTAAVLGSLKHKYPKALSLFGTLVRDPFQKRRLSENSENKCILRQTCTIVHWLRQIG